VLFSPLRSNVTFRSAQSNTTPSGGEPGFCSLNRSGRSPSAVTRPRLSCWTRPSRKSVKKTFREGFARDHVAVTVAFPFVGGLAVRERGIERVDDLEAAGKGARREGLGSSAFTGAAGCASATTSGLGSAGPAVRFRRRRLRLGRRRGCRRFELRRLRDHFFRLRRRGLGLAFGAARFGAALASARSPSHPPRPVIPPSSVAE
jgi:hypothetical protein